MAQRPLAMENLVLVAAIFLQVANIGGPRQVCALGKRYEKNIRKGVRGDLAAFLGDGRLR